MKRRRFLAGAGALAGASGLTIGSGAFTSVSAERSVSIAVTDDYGAFLRLKPLTDAGIDSDPTGRSSTPGDKVRFDIPGVYGGENQEAEGVAPDSVYEFHDLLRIKNQGTQEVTVQSEYHGGALEELALVTDEGRLSEDPPSLQVGDSIDVGLYIDTHGSDTGDYDETLTIVAERAGGNRD
ncbi:hypothetical protein [Natronomonas amylolytica]|uniref:hypothetical protein n=1 Tax=Natronomonas amylolytica TaxID=3108498 RepID=UPI003007F9DE